MAVVMTQRPGEFLAFSNKSGADCDAAFSRFRVCHRDKNQAMTEQGYQQKVQDACLTS
jgi:hypothetical protein